jgi:tRNA pseudouridine38-40 synthase
MTTVRLDIEYDGSRFSGWAAQPGLRTVQGELEEGLRQVLGRSVGVRCVAANVESPEPVETEADDLVAHARRIFAGDLADVVEVD